ncbi:MAG: Cna B-type domain-containing protein [Clostridiaceae bacterium]|nr:Cna B-type domain-containing protein [Clostridiaceae bacterium]
MSKYPRHYYKWLALVLACILAISRFPIISDVMAAELEPGGVLVDKHRSNYELEPGESTDITLSVQTRGFEVRPPKDVIITIDISNSMRNNNVMQPTQTAAKTLANLILNDGSGSRVALVRYGDYASVYNFATGAWIVLDSAGTIEGLSGSDIYTSSYSAVSTRIDNIQNNLSSGYVVWNTNDNWAYHQDEGGTTTEAGIYVATQIAEKATNSSYSVFMSDGVPTSRQIAQNKNANGLYGITRDGNGAATSDDEKSEAIAMTPGLKAAATSFSVAVTLGLSGTTLTNARDVMGAIAGDTGKYYETNNPSADINAIYQSIGTTIVNMIAKNAYVTDIVPAYFDVSNLPAGVTAAAGPGGTTVLTWAIGDLMAGTITKSYTLTLKPGYYGIIDTNESAVLYYSDHAMGSSDPNTLADRTFPIPEIKALPTADNDSYTTPNNTDPYIIPISILDNDENIRIDNAPYDERSAPDLTPTTDRNVQTYIVEIIDPLAAGEGSITAFDYTTGIFTYQPDPTRPPDSGLNTYTVDFTYRLVTIDATGAYRSNIATVTITCPVPVVGTLKINKTLTDSSGNPISTPRDFTFRLTGGDLGPSGLDIVVTTGTEKVVPNLAFGTYTLTEMDPDDLYNTVISPQTFTLSQTNTLVTVTASNQELNKGRITVNKIVRDTDGEIVADGTTFDIRITGPDGYDETKSFTTTLPAVFDNLAYGTYSLTELFEDGYSTTPLSDVVLNIDNRQVEVTVENTLDRVERTVTKIWTDFNDANNLRPDEITVQLLRNGSPFGAPVTLNEANSWSHLFTDLPETDSFGVAYTYTVAEITDVPGYTTTYSTDTFTITNTLDTIEKTVTKIWSDFNDANNLRPDGISVQLLQNGSPFGDPVTLNDSNSWSHLFTDLPESNEFGVDYDDPVAEITAVPGYTTTYSSDTFTITNTLDTTERTVTKIWSDFNNINNLRPDGISVQLLQSGTPFGDPVTLNDSNSWSHLFTDLPETNEFGVDYEYTVAEITDVPGYTTTYSADTFTITNTLDTTERTVIKIWSDFNDANGLRPDEITVQLVRNSTPFGEPVTLNVGNSWSHLFTDLPETNALGEPYIYTVAEITAVPGYTTTYSADTFTITNTLDTTEKTVTKIWSDFNDANGLRPDGISVQLLQSGSPFGDPVTLNEANSWSHLFTDLPETDEFGVDYIYTVAEITAVPGYTTTYSTDTFTITNTLDTTEKTVTKIWSDFNDANGLRPDGISVQLLQNGSPFGDPVTLNEANSWSHLFTDLPETDEFGVDYTYTVAEITAVPGYTTTYSTDTFTITNTLDTTERTVTKVWSDFNDINNLRPDGISVQLLQNGSPFGDPVTLNEANSWSHLFTDLPETDSLGVDYIYTVAEITAVPGYTTTYSVDTFTITNTLDTTERTVTKIWSDFNDANNLRPDSISVQLLQNGSPVGAPVTLNEANSWSHLFTDLPETDSLGVDYIYTVAEITAVPGYTTTYSTDTFTITNTLDTTEKTVTKVWSDFNDINNLRPDGISVQLLQNGSPFGAPVTLNDSNSWSHLFTDLPETDSLGVDYIFTVAEITDVPGYTTTYSTDTFTITNTLDTTEKTVTKIWSDFNDANGLRPDGISVQLLQNNSPFGAPVTLNEANSWSHLFTDLPETDSLGVDYIYTVAEITAVPGYTTTYSTDTFTITNTLDTTERTVTKVWSDFNDANNLRPDGISVQLLQNGSPFGDPVTLNDSNSWSHLFTDLPETDEFGVDYIYTVAEITDVPGYTTTYSTDTFTITNTLDTYQMQLQKFDQRDGTTPLVNAVFELHAVELNESAPVVGDLLETLTTDANGLAVTTSRYAPGQYYLVETAAPAGFHLIADPILITIEVDDESAVEGVITINILDNYINQPSLTVDKKVANVTRGFPAGDLTGLYVGEIAEYTVKVTNNGNTALSQVILTDNQAIPGTSVTTSGGSTLIWASGSDGKATLDLGNLNIGESVTLTYRYTTTAADLAREPILNTAAVSGFMQPTPDYPEGKSVNANDSATITIQDIPLNQAGLVISKQVQNVTRGGVLGDLASGYPGDVFRYAVVVTNTGSLTLTQIKLTDNRAQAGGTVKNVTKGTSTTWIADGTNPVYILIEDLASGESQTFTYEYTSTAADLSAILMNTAFVEGTVAITLDDPQAVVIHDDDTASVAVDQIPKTGEQSAADMVGWSLLLGAAALVIFRRRWHSGDEDAADETKA